VSSYRLVEGRPYDRSDAGRLQSDKASCPDLRIVSVGE
jgi:hypothetical protein